MVRPLRTNIRITRNTVLGVAVLFVLALLSISVFGAGLDDYQERIGGARRDIKKLQLFDAGSDGPSELEDQLLRSIRTEVPRSEKLEWPGGSIDTDNAWLGEGLDRFTAEVNKSKRIAILGHLDERLTAIGEKIAELQAASTASRSKDEDKRKLAEILSREEYQRPTAKEESLFQKWSREIMEWLAKMFPRVNIQPNQSSGLGSLSLILQILLYAALAAGIIFLLYRFLPFFSGRFGKRSKSEVSERVILGERIGDHESSSNLFADAERLARDGELRLAIRKGYIALLCELSERKIIGLARHKTNRDYLRDLRSRSDLLENVRGLTGSFERHWYGAQNSDERAWEEFRSLYRETVRGA